MRTMDVNERYELIREVGEEILTEEELKGLLKKKERFIAYDGFEPSGAGIHIAQGLMRAINVNKLIRAGAQFKMLVADWHAMANNKLGGDLKRIQRVGEYYIELWKACGMELEHVEFVWANDHVKNPDYWHLVMQIARRSTLKRIVRCAQIMGRSESEDLQASQIIYPCMQCADIFFLKADIAQLGLDQRKVNVLARELAPQLSLQKPVVVSHHMLMGLTQPPKGELSAAERATALKMSKSKPDSAIFMTDSEEDVKRKLAKAYCPAGQKEDNPVLEYFRHIIFERVKAVVLRRPEKFGGDLTFASYLDLEKAFLKGEVHPADLKACAAWHINDLIAPVRDHFERDQRARALLAEVKTYELTR